MTQTEIDVAGSGLSDEEARERLARDGPNEIAVAKPPSAVRQLVAQMVHFFALLLWAAAGMSLVAGMPQLAVAIVAVVVLNGVFAFVQERRAEHATQRLAEMLPARVRVRRAGRTRVIDARELVVGDRVVLDSGDKVCGDARLVHVSALGVDESMLTGESAAVRPDTGATVYAGTYVVGGRALADVVATGSRTRLAAIAAQTHEAVRPPSPLAVGLHRVVRTIAVLSVSVGLVFFALAVLLGLPVADGAVLAVGVTVALVPEGLLPTVTLSLARAAQRMASQHALVRNLEAVETLGDTTFVCSDKTGTLTRNEMTVARVWTPAGALELSGVGYEPTGEVPGSPGLLSAVRELTTSAVRSSTGRAVQGKDGRWTAHGDAMEAALHVLGLRLGIDADVLETAEPVRHALPFDAKRRRESVVAGGVLHLKGAPDSVLPRCAVDGDVAGTALRMCDEGLRVLAIARREVPADGGYDDPDVVERDLELLGLVGFADPPREGIERAVAQCRQAGVRLAVVTGDHPATARAVAQQVGLLLPDSPVVVGADLPADDASLGRLLDHDGAVVARVTPEDKLRIARALQGRGHVVAMTGDGVNDGPALREADIGVAMGRSGTDVARAAADMVLLDDAFPTIVRAIELGRATTGNIRRFLTYHLTDNVAELAPFVVFGLTAGAVPLALTVLMVLALDIGTDLLPALALGAEPPDPHVLDERPGQRQLVDRSVLVRAFLVLGPTEAAAELLSFLTVLLVGGWRFGDEPTTGLLLVASGAAFTTVVLGQLANAFACRSEQEPVWRVPWASNPLLLLAVGFELATLAAFLAVPPLARALELRPPTALGWALAALAAPLVVVVDAVHKTTRRKT